MTGIRVFNGKSSRLRAAACCAVFTVSTLFGVCAHADDDNARKSNAWSTQTLTKTGLNLDLNVSDLDIEVLSSSETSITGISPVLKNALFNLPSDTTSPLFELDLSGGVCLDTSVDCADEMLNSLELDFEHDFAKGGYKNIDLALTPRAGVRRDNESSSALVGALVKIGDNLNAKGGIDSNTWYVFAGADAQALSYAPGGQIFGTDQGQFAFQEHVIVGDAQAGVAYRIGGADVSLTYLRRKTRAENFKFEEDAAALSLTWRR